jgi:hypothetical protein
VDEPASHGFPNVGELKRRISDSLDEIEDLIPEDIA